MTQSKTQYDNPLVSRWGSSEMSYIFSPEFKFTTWRKLWIALAEHEKELGLDIPDAALTQMRAHLHRIDYDRADAIEKERRHDVMAHVEAFGEQCPAAKPIIHLGATSCYVGDNTELIQMRDGLKLIATKIASVISKLSEFAQKYAEMPTLGFTHYQPAQLTTVGKRATLWIQDLLYDLDEVERWIANLPFRGVKGTTGTQASFMALFDNDESKVLELDRRVTETMGFKTTVSVCGQTYPRKLDAFVVNALVGAGVSAHKFANDIRLLANLKEIEEPFEKSQIGSSAMAYKRNPMRCERITGLARHLIALQADPAMTAAEQWFERTLDDSSNRRISIAESFLTADAILTVYQNVAGGLVVYPEMIARHIRAELPFMATEEIIMAGVKAGGDRQALHEAIRVHSRASAEQVKLKGEDNDLLERLTNDPLFAKVKDDFGSLTDPSRFVGRAPSQTRLFVKTQVQPVIERYRSQLGGKADLRV